MSLIPDDIEAQFQINERAANSLRDQENKIITAHLDNTDRIISQQAAMLVQGIASNPGFFPTAAP